MCTYMCTYMYKYIYIYTYIYILYASIHIIDLYIYAHIYVYYRCIHPTVPTRVCLQMGMGPQLLAICRWDKPLNFAIPYFPTR